MNWALFNPRDIALIAAATIAVMIIAKPLLAVIDNATD